MKISKTETHTLPAASHLPWPFMWARASLAEQLVHRALPLPDHLTEQQIAVMHAHAHVHPRTLTCPGTKSLSPWPQFHRPRFRLPTANHGPKIPSFPSHWHYLLLASSCWQCQNWMVQDHLMQMILLLTYLQKVSSSLTLCHVWFHFILSCRDCGISCHPEKKGECSTVSYFERGRPHSHNCCYSILL